MPSLHELQRAFAAALMFEETGDLEPHVIANGIEPAARLRIYRNNMRENFLAALRAAYPVLERLVGAQYFRQLVADYLQCFPSTSGDLQYAGERLVTYLERRFAAGEYAYFVDVARLEWAYQEVLVAPEHPPADLERLRTVPPAAYAGLRLELHPAVRLVESRYPVLTIWSANQVDADSEKSIDLRRGGEHVLVQRMRDAVELVRLPHHEFTFLAALNTGATLLDAAQAAAACAGPAFDLGLVLRRHVGRGAIVGIHCSSSLPRENDS